MNIGITCYPVAGGSGVVATELGQKLATRGHQVHFISYALPFRLDKFQANLMFHGVDTTSYPLPFFGATGRGEIRRSLHY